ncbi:MAG: DUF418 domain-containing protein [Fimbriimonadaceae bacterium]
MSVVATLRNRIQSLDVLRGVAILGILLANIFAFGWTDASEMMGGHLPIPGLNYWVEGIRIAFVSGKFRGLFCLLFGAGLFLQYGKLKAAGKWPRTYLRRTAILMAIGAIHIVLIWFGDILFMYSLTAFIVMWLVGLDDRVIIGIATGMLFLTTLCGIGSVAAFSSSSEAFGEFGSFFTPQNEMRIFQSGSFYEQLQFRLPIVRLTMSFFPVLFLELGGLFLIGFWMAKNGIFAKPSAHPKATLFLIIVGILGALVNIAIGIGIGITQNEKLSMAIEFGLNAPMAVGYATVGSVLVEKYPEGILSRLFAPVGKMALTGYLLTSVLCTTFFYSWGFGMFGKLDYAGLIGVVLVVWIFIVTFAHIWLRKYAMGPIEWVWRSLTLGRQDLKLSDDRNEITGDTGLPPVIR